MKYNTYTCEPLFSGSDVCIAGKVSLNKAISALYAARRLYLSNPNEYPSHGYITWDDTPGGVIDNMIYNMFFDVRTCHTLCDVKHRIKINIADIIASLTEIEEG